VLVVVTSRRVRRLVYKRADTPGVATTRGEDNLGLAAEDASATSLPHVVDPRRRT
jgi:hypothetical protein